MPETLNERVLFTDLAVLMLGKKGLLENGLNCVQPYPTNVPVVLWPHTHDLMKAEWKPLRLQMPRELFVALLELYPQSMLSLHVKTDCGPFTFLNLVLAPAGLPALLVVARGKLLIFLAEATKAATAVTAVALDASFAAAALVSTGLPAIFLMRTVSCLSLAVFC
jgi:hypothetical protein